VATEGSFSRAADRLGIGRSAVSRSVQRLENQLNVRLFLRTTLSTTLTQEGDLFFTRFHTGVDRIFEALDGMRQLRQGRPRGHVRICSTVCVGRLVVARLVAEVRADYLEVSIELLLRDMSTNFVSGRIEVDFLNGRMEDAEIIARQIIPMHMLVCASPA